MLRAKPFGRTMEVLRKVFHRVDVGTCCALRVVATLEFIQHHLPKMGHGKPPCDPRLTQQTMPEESPCSSARRANGLVQTLIWEANRSAGICRFSRNDSFKMLIVV